MVSIKLNVTADIGQLIRVNRYAKQNQAKLLDIAANRYLRFLRNRYRALAAGGGDWPELAESTVTSKFARGVAEDPEAILREYDVLLNSLDKKVVGGKTFVGYVKDRKHPRGNSVFRLVVIHASQRRKIIVLPGSAVRRKMIEDIKKEYAKAARQERRKK